MPPTAKPGASDYDLIVIGAGSGGLATAKRAASYGARVLIVEADRVGGTCVIRGCIPKKLMVYAAEIGQAIDAGPGYGWQSERAGCDWPLLVRRRNDAVTTLERNHERYLGEAGVELVRGRARLAGPNHVTVGRDPYSTRYVLIATGARPVLPPIAGIEHAITSDGFFELGQRPDRVLLVGSGYIAVELAGILCGLGARVTVVARGDRPLRGFDDDLRAALLDCLRADGIDVRTAAAVERIDMDGSVRKVCVRDSKGEEVLAVDAVIYATGRKPNTNGLGLEDCGVRLGHRGEVLVDAHGCSSVASVLAVGDVIDRRPLTPVAIQAGRALADRVFGGKTTEMRYEDVPTAVFSEPPIATVGLTEREARERYGENGIRVYKSRFTPLIHALTGRKVQSLVKLVVERSTDRVVGCHMLGRDAPEIIQGFAVAIKAGATKATFDATVGIHPSSAEEFVTLR
jgi:glutathione reductase (NADPH)